MNWNIFDYGVIAFAAIVGIGMIVSYFLLCNDAPKKALIKSYLVVSVCFLLFCYCGYMSPKFQAVAQDFKKDEKYSHEVFITDGDIDDQKMHLCCNEAVKEFFDPYDEYLDVDCIMDCLNETLKDNGIEPSKTIYDAVQQWSELTSNINTLK